MESHRKWPISISVSSQGTKSVIILLHTVMHSDFSPIEFFHVPRTSNLKCFRRGGEMVIFRKRLNFEIKLPCHDEYPVFEMSTIIVSTLQILVMTKWRVIKAILNNAHKYNLRCPIVCKATQHCVWNGMRGGPDCCVYYCNYVHKNNSSVSCSLRLKQDSKLSVNGTTIKQSLDCSCSEQT